MTLNCLSNLHVTLIYYIVKVSDTVIHEDSYCFIHIYLEADKICFRSFYKWMLRMRSNARKNLNVKNKYVSNEKKTHWCSVSVLSSPGLFFLSFPCLPT